MIGARGNGMTTTTIQILLLLLSVLGSVRPCHWKNSTPRKTQL